MARRHCFAVCAAALIALTACDGGSGGDDGDNPPTTPPTVSFPEDPNKAPSVPDPIYPEAFIDKPCSSLTTEQRNKFDLDGGKADYSGTGMQCTYQYTNSDHWIRINYATEVPGLQRLYENGPNAGTRWKPEVLDDYPAVITERAMVAGVPSYPPRPASTRSESPITCSSTY